MMAFLVPTLVHAQAVVTFSSATALQATEKLCPGTGAAATVRVRRNGVGNIITIIREGKSETVLTSGGGHQCNPLQDVVVDVWRADDGLVKGIVQVREEGRKLVIGDNEFRGFRYDLEPTGTYFVLSQGNQSSIAAVSRPFRKLLTLDIDAQRLFTQGRRLIVIGNNPRSGSLEYRIIQPSAESLSVVRSGAVGNQPAGVRVLDFHSGTGNLLIGGANDAGQIQFLMVNMLSGGSRVIPPQRAGDDMALFVDDASLRRALTGSSAAASGTARAGGLRLFSR
jgi:hypothetical protein